MSVKEVNIDKIRTKACRFQEECDNPSCTYAHSFSEFRPQLCRYGTSCRIREDCIFVHDSQEAYDVFEEQLEEIRLEKIEKEKYAADRECFPGKCGLRVGKECKYKHTITEKDVIGYKEEDGTMYPLNTQEREMILLEEERKRDKSKQTLAKEVVFPEAAGSYPATHFLTMRQRFAQGTSFMMDQYGQSRDDYKRSAE